MNENRERINESIIRDMSEGVMTINMGGVIDSINPAAERILGKTKDEVLGKKYIRVFMKDKANDVFNQAVLDAMYDPDSKHEKIVSWNNGSQTKQLYMVTSMLFHENRKMGTIIVFGDITELSELKLRYAQDIEKLLHSLVKALSIAIDERSHYTGNHTRNMVDMAEAAGYKFVWSWEDVRPVEPSPRAVRPITVFHSELLKPVMSYLFAKNISVPDLAKKCNVSGPGMAFRIREGVCMMSQMEEMAEAAGYRFVWSWEEVPENKD